MLGGAGNDWEDLVGSPVLPRWMTVTDDPTLRSMDGHPVENYRVDEDGVATRATTVVDHGMLKTLLTTRTPVTGIDHSTGNKFGGGARPVHVTLTADSALSDQDMRKKLLAMAAAQGRNYGIVVRQLAGGGAQNGDDMMGSIMGQPRGNPTVRGMIVVKLFADGHEEPMRGAEISGVSASSFKDIAAATQKRTVHTEGFVSPGSFMAGNAGSGGVTYLMPSLLFSNLSVRKPKGTTPKLPFVPPPPQ
jgi:TldD protein